MALIEFPRRPAAGSDEPTDTALLALFESDPEGAWDLFIERYAGLILSALRYLGFDHDEAMDRFVYICEKLCEHDFRRLRTIRFAGRAGDLTPWVRTVVKHLSVNWAWSLEGRRRLFKSISDLPTRPQRIFELYFWRGLTPSEVHEQLCVEEQEDIQLLDVLDDLELIFTQLNAHQTWRLMSQLMRHRQAVRIAEHDPEAAGGFEPRDAQADPEAQLLRSERRRRVEIALAELAPRERLILQLRYEDALSLKEVAEIVSLSLSAVKRSVQAGLSELRRRLAENPATPGETPCPA